MLRASESQTRDTADALTSVWRKISVGDPSWPKVTQVLAESLLATHRHANALRLWKRLTLLLSAAASVVLLPVYYHRAYLSS